MSLSAYFSASGLYLKETLSKSILPSSTFITGLVGLEIVGFSTNTSYTRRIEAVLIEIIINTDESIIKEDKIIAPYVINDVICPIVIAVVALSLTSNVYPPNKTKLIEIYKAQYIEGLVIPINLSATIKPFLISSLALENFFFS